jgi:hypothetical protein
MENSTNYLLIIILISVVLFLFCDTNKEKVEKFNTINGNGNKNDEKDITIKEYISDHSSKLMNDKMELELRLARDEFRSLPEYNYGFKSRELKNEFEKFNNKLDELMIVNTVEDSQIKENITDFINNIDKTDKEIYNNFVLDYYDDYKTKIIKDEEQFNKQLTEIETHETFANTIVNSNYKNNIQLEPFLGKYYVLPFQYKEFNNIYMILTKDAQYSTNGENQNENHNKYLLGFYVLDELICDFKINLFKKTKPISDITSDITSDNKDIEDNLMGYELQIVKENPNKLDEFKFPKYRNNAKKILNELGIIENMNLYIFIVKSQYDKHYLNTDGSIEGVDPESYFHKDADDMFRLYNKNGATLLHLGKKNIIDKPFQSLIN